MKDAAFVTTEPGGMINNEPNNPRTVNLCMSVSLPTSKQPCYYGEVGYTYTYTYTYIYRDREREREREREI